MTTSEIKFQCVVAGVFAIISFTFFQFLNPYPLSIMDTGDDFIYSWTYFLSFFDKPAGIARYAESFVYQFLSLEFASALIVSFLLLLQWYLILMVLKRMKEGNMASLYALYPVAVMWALYCGPVSLASGFSFSIVMCLFLAYSYIYNRKYSIAAGFLLLFMTYVLGGGSTVSFVLLIFLYESRKGKRRWIYWCLLLLTGLILPAVLDFYYKMGDLIFLYPYTSIDSLAPAIVLYFGLLLLRVDVIRRIRLNIKNLSVALSLFFLLLLSSVYYRNNRMITSDQLLTVNPMQP